MSDEDKDIYQKKQRGWQGQELEMDHARESWSKSADKAEKSGTVAVDLEQFRNHTVGEGYQAKFVVRQRTSTQEDENKLKGAKDIAASKKEDDRKKRKRSEKKSSSSRTSDMDGSSSSKNDPHQKLRKYLQCEGLRKFIKELQKISQES